MTILLYVGLTLTALVAIVNLIASVLLWTDGNYPRSILALVIGLFLVGEIIFLVVLWQQKSRA